MWLFAAFLIVPIIEITLFVQVGGWLTLWPTLAIVVGTAIAGTLLLRWQGTQVLRDLQREMATGGNPAAPLAHGALIVLGGIFMILPGFFTDALGILLMFPPVRSLVIRLVLARIAAGGGPQFVYRSAARPQDPTIIDGDFSEIPPSSPQNRPPSDWTKD